MSTDNLLSYAHPPESLYHVPSYTAEPLANEQRIAFSARTRPRPNGSFVKQSKHGHARLRLTAQENGLTMPVYGIGETVEGKVEIMPEKIEGIESVEAKIEGLLELKETKFGNNSSIGLVLDTVLLWAKGPGNVACPSMLNFSFSLPSIFTFQERTYPLPPTYNAKLRGIPGKVSGFAASIDYAISVSVNKPNTALAMGPLVKLKSLGMNNGTLTVSTPFLYYPRTCPAMPLPLPLHVILPFGFHVTPDWRSYETVSKAKQSRIQDVVMRLYVPRCRIFCFKDPIPFYLSMESSAASLASFMPFGPSIGPARNKAAMKIEVLRQATASVRNEMFEDTNLDMWQVDCIGQGSFTYTANDTAFTAFSGEIRILDTIQTGGFEAAQLTVKDSIVFTMNPPDPMKCPFGDLRLVVPIQLTTDPWRN